MAELEVEAKLNITAIFEDGINDVEKSKKPRFSIRLLILFKFFHKTQKISHDYQKKRKIGKVVFCIFWIFLDFGDT